MVPNSQRRKGLHTLRRKYIIALLSITVSVCLSSFGYYFYQILYTPNVLPKQSDASLYIYPGDTFSKLLEHLREHNYLEDPVSFAFLARLMNYDRQIKAGFYKIPSHVSNLTLLKLLRSGAQTPLRVRFHGLRLLKDLAPRLDKQLRFTHQEILPYLCSDSIAQIYGFRLQTFPLMFIPNSYEMYWTIRPQAFLEYMHQAYKQFWNPVRLARAKALGLTPIEVGILASIVQAETRMEEEKPRIAGVYLNRLRRRIPLSADPTLIFALKDFSIKRVLDRDKRIDSPFNTYKYPGLPPGPINLPEISSVDAVLMAEKHQYLYFCAKADFSGYHVFSKTLRQHNVYARQYHRALNKAKQFR